MEDKKRDKMTEMQRNDVTGKNKDTASLLEIAPVSPMLSLWCCEWNFSRHVSKIRVYFSFLWDCGCWNILWLFSFFQLGYREAYSLLPLQNMMSGQSWQRNSQRKVAWILTPASQTFKFIPCFSCSGTSVCVGLPLLWKMERRGSNLTRIRSLLCFERT